MNAAVGLIGVLLIALNLWDGFETVVLPRRVSRQVGISRLFIHTSSRLWYRGSRLLPRGWREDFLGLYGPLGLLLLLAAWGVGIILGFGLLDWALGSPFASSQRTVFFSTDLYFSGGAFVSSPPADVVPAAPLTRLLTVAEAGTGLGFLALVISYLPVLYQSFAQREIRISMLDEWAGSPPTALALLSRLARYDNIEGLDPFLREWEEWSAELLETHLSYPILAFFRSQHENQSWLAALTTILDTCTLVIVGTDDIAGHHARLTFAMARHAIVDLCQVFASPPEETGEGRLPREALEELRKRMDAAGVPLRAGPEADKKFAEIRKQYEPYVFGLSRTLLLKLPPWLPPAGALDNWQTSAYGTEAAHFS